MNDMTKRLREIFKEVNESLTYGNEIANSVYNSMINNYYYIKDCGDIYDIDNRISDVIYGLSTLYGYDMEPIDSKARYVLHNLNAPYEISTMLMNDIAIQLRKFEIDTDDIFLFGVHQGLYQGIINISKEMENDNKRTGSISD